MAELTNLPYLGAGDPERLCLSFIHEGQFLCVAIREDGTIVYVTEGLTELLGFEPAEFVGANIVDFIHPADIERALLMLNLSASVDTVAGLSRFDVRHKSGDFVPLEAFGNAIFDGVERLFGVYARRPFHQVVIEEILVLLLRGTPRDEVLVPVCDVIQWREYGSHLAISWEDGSLHQVSTGIVPELGGDDRRAGTPWADPERLGPEGIEGDISTLPEDLAATAAAAGLARWWVSPVRWSGGTSPALLTIWTRGELVQPRYHSYGLNVARSMVELILSWDYTQRKLIAQRKLASMGSLAAGLAHEIRNPLNFITNFSEIGLIEAQAQRDVPRQKTDGHASDDDSGVAGCFTLIHKHAARIDAIVRGILEHSGDTGTPVETVDLSSLFEEHVMAGYESYQRSHDGVLPATIRFLVPEGVRAAVHSEELGRVVINLVENACASLDERGRSEPSFEPQIEATLEDRGSSCLLSITDNGMGIDPAVRDRIFDPFFTTRAPGEGTGLGLSMCHQIITELHGGEISCESAQGQYARFVFSIPTT